MRSDGTVAVPVLMTGLGDNCDISCNVLVLNMLVYALPATVVFLYLRGDFTGKVAKTMGWYDGDVMWGEGIWKEHGIPSF